MARIKTVDRIRKMDEITEERIRVAVLVERERCAQVAEGMWHAAHKDIAAAIREDPEKD